MEETRSGDLQTADRQAGDLEIAPPCARGARFICRV